MAATRSVVSLRRQPAALGSAVERVKISRTGRIASCRQYSRMSVRICWRESRDYLFLECFLDLEVLNFLRVPSFELLRSSFPACPLSVTSTTLSTAPSIRLSNVRYGVTRRRHAFPILSEESNCLVCTSRITSSIICSSWATSRVSLSRGMGRRARRRSPCSLRSHFR